MKYGVPVKVVAMSVDPSNIRDMPKSPDENNQNLLVRNILQMKKGFCKL